MGDMDKPPQYEKPKTEIRAPKQPDKEKSIEEKARELENKPFYRFLLHPNQQKPTDPNSLEISIGQVSMNVPKTWTLGEDRAIANGGRFVNYKINGDKDATLSFYYRGKRCSEMYGKRFHEALKQPPHELTDKELDSLSEIIRRMDGDLTKTVARTETMNGKRVLLLEGNIYKGKPEEEYVRSIYIDSDGTGTAVQEVYFQAKPNKYREHLKEVEAAFNGIVWHS